MHMCTCMTLHAGKRNSSCLYSNKHASFPPAHVSASSRQRVYFFPLILAVGYDIPYPYYVEEVNSTRADARWADHSTGLAALPSIGVPVTSPTTPSPLLPHLEQRPDFARETDIPDNPPLMKLSWKSRISINAQRIAYIFSSAQLHH